MTLLNAMLNGQTQFSVTTIPNNMKMKRIAHRHSKQKIYYTQPRTLLNPILDLDKINWLSQLD
jgi:hypothetical protein